MLVRRKSKKRKVVISVFIGLIGAVFACVGLVVVLYLMAVYKPSEYSPEPITFAQQEQAVDQAISLIADIHNNVYAMESFSESISADLLNKLLLHQDLTRLLEKEFANTDVSIRHPQVSLRDGMIILFVTMKYDSYNAVVSIALRPQIDSGGMLVIKLKTIKSGMLGVPMMVIQDYLVQAADKIKMYIDNTVSDDHVAGKQSVEKELGRFIGQALPELLRGGRFEVKPVINNPDDGDKQIQLTSIKIEDQLATMEFTQLQR